MIPGKIKLVNLTPSLISPLLIRTRTPHPHPPANSYRPIDLSLNNKKLISSVYNHLPSKSTEINSIYHEPVNITCVASVLVRFRSKERGTRVKDRAKSIFRAAKTENPFPRSFNSLLPHQTETLATQATVNTNRSSTGVFYSGYKPPRI